MTTRKRREIKDIRDKRTITERLSALAGASMDLNPDRSKTIMVERARLLAQPLAAGDAQTAETIVALTFSLGNEKYAIEMSDVLEVGKLSQITPVPGGPIILIGLTNLRGIILALFDIGQLMGLAARGMSELSRIIVLGRSVPEFGILADNVHDVRIIGREEILPLSGSMDERNRDNFIGVTQDALIVLNGDALLRHPDLFVDER